MSKERLNTSRKSAWWTRLRRRPLAAVPTIVTCVGLLAAAIYALATRPSRDEPRINGQALSRWLVEDHYGEELSFKIDDPQAWTRTLIELTRRQDSLATKLEIYLWDKIPETIRSTLRRPVSAEEVHAEAISWLELLGPAAEAAVPRLQEISRNPALAGEHAMALSALAIIDPDSSTNLNLVLSALGSSDRFLQTWAAWCLPYFGPRAAPAAPVLIGLIGSNTLGLARSGNFVLGLTALGPVAGTALSDVLSQCLTNVPPWSAERHWAIVGLIGVGPAGAPAVPYLTTLLCDPTNASSFPQVFEALASIGSAAERALPQIDRFLTHSDPVLRAMASLADARIRGQPSNAVPRLLAELINGEFRQEHTGWPLRLSSHPGEPPLGLDHRETAAWHLGELGPLANDALPILQDIAQSSTGRLALIAARSVGRISGNPNRALSVFERCLFFNDEQLARLAAQLLGQMGPAARPALPALTRALQIREAGEFGTLIRAIKAIDPAAVAATIQRQDPLLASARVR